MNISVVGCGYWGPNLIRNFNALSECTVTSIFDINLERLNYLSELYPSIKNTTNYDDIINDNGVDAVAIATPVSLHYKYAKKSLFANKHTFIEKPMATSVAECKELIDIAKKNKVTLMVGHTFVYTSAVHKIKKIVDDGDIGEILYIASRRLNLGLFQKDINVVWDLAPHDISIILHIMKHEPVSVNCQGKGHTNPQIEDVSSMTLDFENGGFAIIHSSWLDPNKIREMTIVGSKRMIVYNDNEPLEKIKIYDKSVEVPPHYDTFAEFQYSYHYGDMYSPYLKQEEPLKVECQHFINCASSGKIPLSSGLDGLHVVQILEAASESLKNGGSRIAVK
jgi:predicted dehydrogenase